MPEITNEGYPDIPFNQPEIIQPKKKKSKKIIITILVVILVTIGIVGVGFAKKMKNFHDHGPLGFMIEKMTEGIDLDANQKTQVDQIKQEIKDKIESRKDSHKQ